MSVAANGPLVVVEELAKYFPARRGVLGQKTGQIKAVDGISFQIQRGETLALVGESGCGKTTTGRLILRLLNPTSGHVLFDGAKIQQLDAPALKSFRRRAQIIFQDPYGSLNPRMTVGAMLGEVLRVHGIARGAQTEHQISELLEGVGLQPNDARKYPHEFSGGQRQRVGIARALAVRPEFIVADEPVSALDVSVQAQTLNLLIDLQQRFDLTYLFITHDLSVVRHIADNVAVMYLGKIIEIGCADSVFGKPAHPYTQTLLSAVPEPGGQARERIALTSDVASPAATPSGCPFHPRCPHPQKDSDCRSRLPRLKAADGGALAACHKL